MEFSLLEKRTSGPRLRMKIPGSRAGPHLLLWIAALAIAVVLVGRDLQRLSTPFGPSHDGFNAAVYMTGGRALVEDGPLVSRLGASSRTLSGDRVVYAHHPPLVYLADAAALASPVSIETAARLPAVVSSLLVLVVLVLLLAACELPSGPSAVGLAFAFLTPMFLMFGTVDEPLILGLAPITALTLLWQRARRGLRPPWWALAAVSGAATFTSWHAGLFAACVGLALLLVERRRSAAFTVFAGTAISAILVGLWILWAYHGIGDFVDRAVSRTGAGGVDRVTFGQVARQQMGYFSDLFPIGSWLVVPIAGLGVLDRRTRPLVTVSLGTVLAYALLFRKGAYDHSYWLYPILLPLALSGTIVADAAARWLSHHTWLRPGPLVVAAALVAVLGITTWRPSKEERHRRWAAAIGAQARALRWPAEQRYAYVVFGNNTGPTDLLPWVLFYSRRQPFIIDGPRSVPRGQVILRSVDGRLIFVAGEQ